MISDSKKDFSIALWISAALVVVTTGLVGVEGARNAIAERRLQRARLSHDLDLTTSQLAAGLSLPLWNFDGPQIDRLIDSAMERQDVYSVEVTQPDATAPGGQIVHRRVRFDEGNSSTKADPTSDLLVLEREVLSTEGPIGKVRVSVTPRFLDAEQRAHLITLVFEIAALAVLIVAGLYVLLWRIVIHPIQVLEGFAQAMSAGRPFVRVPSDRGGSARFYGELESLRASIARTFELLEARYDALRKNESMLSSILNSVPQSIFWKSRTGEYLGSNEVFARTVGLAEPSEILGKTDADLPWPSEHVESSLREDQSVIESGLPQPHIVARLEDKNGHSRWIDTTKVPLRDQDGRIYGVLGVCDDVTDRRRAEAERLELEAQLRQSQKMEAIGTLAGGIAHDFNNLLSAIRGNAQLAAKQVDSANRAMALTSISEIERASKRATDLVRQIVGFSRPAEETREVVDLRQLVREVMALMRSVLPAGVLLGTESVGDPPVVFAAASQLHQVLVNLLTNAWQAIGTGPGRISIRLEQREFGDAAPRGLEPGTYACIGVSDTGRGMTAEVRERIFEPFFTTQARGHGTGLGLATVRGIVTAHRGVIDVESTEGVGSAFVIYLPATERQAKVESPEAKATTIPVGESLRIYYVDDEEALVFLVTRQLESCGHQVRGFSSSVAALETIQTDPSAFDVLVTDCNMPRMPGLQLIARVLELRPDARIVLTTGYLSDDIKAAADKLHLKTVIDKPTSVEELCDAIHRSALATEPNQETA